MTYRHLWILVACALLLSCTAAPAQDPLPPVTGTQDLVLGDADLGALGMRTNGSSCTTEAYETSEYSPLAQYSMCTYLIGNETELVLEVSRYTNRNDLNGSYQYSSSHLFGAPGLMAEDTFGDQSRFRVNNDADYGAEFNPPGVYYYHLWITKDDYLIHLTSKGAEDAKWYIERAANTILARFG